MGLGLSLGREREAGEVSGGGAKHARRKWRRRAEREAREASGGRIKLARRKRRAPGMKGGGVAGERRTGGSPARGARLKADSPPASLANGRRRAGLKGFVGRRMPVSKSRRHHGQSVGRAPMARSRADHEDEHARAFGRQPAGPLLRSCGYIKGAATAAPVCKQIQLLY